METKREDKTQPWDKYRPSGQRTQPTTARLAKLLQASKNEKQAREANELAKTSNPMFSNKAMQASNGNIEIFTEIRCSRMAKLVTGIINRTRRKHMRQ